MARAKKSRWFRHSIGHDPTFLPTLFSPTKISEFLALCSEPLFFNRLDERGIEATAQPFSN